MAAPFAAIPKQQSAASGYYGADQQQTGNSGAYEVGYGNIYQNSGLGNGYTGYNPTESSTGTSGTGSNTGTTNGTNLLSGLGNSLSSLASNSGNLALYGGLYTLEAGQAQNAEKENAALAGQITAIGAPAVGESQSLLGSYSQGNLTGPFQQQLTAALAGNKNAATSESQQSAQLLANSGGGANVGSALASQNEQIQNQKAINDAAAVSNAFASELASSNSLLQAGGPYVQNGVTTEINSNTQLQNQLSQLMGALASAYAQSTSGKATTPTAPKSSSGGGGSGGGGQGQQGAGSSAGTGENYQYAQYAPDQYQSGNSGAYEAGYGYIYQ